MIVLARWESRGGAHYVELRKSDGGYHYAGCNCGGWLSPTIKSNEAAVATMQARVDSGYFLPDKAKVPMKRIGGFDPKVRIKLGPTYHSGGDFWEVTVNLPVYSAKLAGKAFNALPVYVEIADRIYRRAGMRASDCAAWYRSKGK